jgi:hypothetical protein
LCWHEPDGSQRVVHGKILSDLQRTVGPVVSVGVCLQAWETTSAQQLPEVSYPGCGVRVWPEDDATTHEPNLEGGGGPADA